jgi:hypothetical protein
MKRHEMAKRIDEYVPFLASHYKSEWKKAEKLHTNFVKDFPRSKLHTLTLDEYVIGKGAESQSFCYRLEREMISLGSIRGATAYKFGIYYGKTAKDETLKYRFRKRWGSNIEDAFSSIKDEIITLLQAASDNDFLSLRKNRVSPMFKGKLLFVYYPDQYAPIYSLKHLQHFLSELNLDTVSDSNVDLQRALMEYRDKWPALNEQPVVLYMRFLYDTFPLSGKNAAKKDEMRGLPLLKEAVRGAVFIDKMPPITTIMPSNKKKRQKNDYEERQRELTWIGNRGEAIVWEKEIERLTLAGKSELAKNIKHVSQDSDSEGYDILSFEEDGTTRFIEVKATTSSNLERGFYITTNELEKAKTLKNYYIYLVFSANTNKSKILQIKHPSFDGSDFELQPITYHAKLKVKE